MGSQKIYTEKEATEILKRASTLEEPSDYQPGISHDELVRMAEEMGIDRASLERVLRNQPPETRSAFSSLFRETYEHVVEGELDPNDLDLLVEALNGKNLNAQQPLRQVGRTLQGNTMVGPGQYNINVSSRNGRTRIQAQTTNILGIVLGAELGIFTMVGALAALNTTGNPVFGAVAAAGLAAGYGFFHWMGQSGSRKGREAFERLCRAVEENAKRDSLGSRLVTATQEDAEAAQTESHKT